MTMHLISREVRTLRAGGEAVVTRLADVLTVMALRKFLESRSPSASGYLAALTDERIGRALVAMHQTPEAPFTLESLAHTATLSRARFASEFHRLVGQSPMKYLTEYRMNEARLTLRERDVSLTDLAERYGYESEPAFSRAFKRVIGVPPSAIERAMPTETP